MEAEHLSEVVGHLYDAAVDAEHWPIALEAACGFVGGCAANLFSQDAATQNAVRHYSWGEDPHYEQQFFQTYASLNPFYPAAVFLPVGEVFAGSDIIPNKEFQKTRFFREWVGPQGRIDSLLSNIERTATTASAFSIQRSRAQGLADTAAKRRFGLLVPHMRRAATIGRIIGFQQVREQALLAILDKLETAVILVSGNGRLVQANPSGGKLLESGELVRLSRGRVEAVRLDAKDGLSAAITAAGKGDGEIGDGGIAIPLQIIGSNQTVAHVLPLSRGLRRDAGDSDAVAAIFIQRFSLAQPTSLEAVAARFKLTPSETRVLAAVMEAGSIPEQATRLGISRATLKTHLNHLYSKTGARRQVDLVRLMTGYGLRQGDL